MIEYRLSGGAEAFRSDLTRLEDESIVSRIWDHDHTVWAEQSSEITNRLGWLDIPEAMMSASPEILEFSTALKSDGIESVVLLGMGGSSLAPDVLTRVFEVRDGFPLFEVLDTTHPDAIQRASSRLNLIRTVFIVSTKSGTTVETLSLFRFFYNQVKAVSEGGEPGSHFVAITDPGSQLEQIAEQYQFRKTFLNDPDIGGRYSALSYFGLVPAAVMGIDVRVLLEHALQARVQAKNSSNLIENNAAILGTLLGTMAKHGRDKLTFIMSDEIAPLGDWIEQLIAESTGKLGVGILPVVGEQIRAPEDYHDDRLFVQLTLQGDDTRSASIQKLIDAGHPVVNIEVASLETIGGLFFMWEFATAIAGYWLEINPFDQPNVESAKERAREMVAAYQEQGALPAQSPSVELDRASIFMDPSGAKGVDSGSQGGTLSSVLASFLATGSQDGYLAIQAYLPASDETTQALQKLRFRIGRSTRTATTLGFGPRYLHSTGQLHKGDGGQGMFLQITADKEVTLEIPDEAGRTGSSITFNTLIDAQALGDRKALLEAGRRTIRLHLKHDPASVLGDIVFD